MKFIYLSIFLLNLLYCISFSETTLLNDYKNSYEKKINLPTLESKNLTITVAQAYKTQQEWVSFLLSQEYKKYGFKASLTSKKDQDLYNINNPIFTVALSKKALNNFDVIYKEEYLNPFMKVRLAIKLKKSITKKIDNSYDLKKYIQQVFPVVEIIDYNFKNIETLNFNDLIISNSGESQFIFGDRVFLKDISKINLKINNTNNNKTFNISQFTSEDILKQIKWVINRSLENNWKINKGDILFSSSFIQKEKLPKGTNTLAFTNYSSIVFDVR